LPEGAGRPGNSWRDGCVGTGPFRVLRFESNRRLELEANPDYWRAAYPKNDGIIFSFGVAPQEILSGFRAGRYSIAADLFPSDVEALRHEPEFASGYRETPRLSTYYVMFNVHRGPLADEKLRHMLVQSMDVEAMVRRYAGRLAIPAHGMIHSEQGYEGSFCGLPEMDRLIEKAAAVEKEQWEKVAFDLICDGRHQSLSISRMCVMLCFKGSNPVSGPGMARLWIPPNNS